MSRFVRPRWFALTGFVLVAGILLASLAIAGILPTSWLPGSSHPASANGGLDTQLPGTLAPGFTLTDQFGHQHQLSEFQGKVVVLAFIDSRCTDTCPLTAAILKQARDQLGGQASQVQLLAVNANPIATKVSDVLDWSNNHQMTQQWLFLTGPAAQLKPIWTAYHVDSEVEPNGDVTHTPAVYLLDRQGHERWMDLMDSTKSSMPSETASLRQQLAGLLGH